MSVWMLEQAAKVAEVESRPLPDIPPDGEQIAEETGLEAAREVASIILAIETMGHARTALIERAGRLQTIATRALGENVQAELPENEGKVAIRRMKLGKAAPHKEEIEKTTSAGFMPEELQPAVEEWAKLPISSLPADFAMMILDAGKPVLKALKDDDAPKPKVSDEDYPEVLKEGRIELSRKVTWPTVAKLRAAGLDSCVWEPQPVMVVLERVGEVDGKPVVDQATLPTK